MESKFRPVIGLEVHVQLKTVSKMFCGCSAEFGSEPNTNICPVCTGQPGVLPVANKKAIELSIRTAVALGCSINSRSIFARKNYFYPDMPKNYQISQYEEPLGVGGYLDIVIGGREKSVRIKRVHLEEDAGKLLHAIGSRELDYSLVDLNRAGIALLEIVTEPDLDSPEEAHAYLNFLKASLQYLGVSDCDMEKGLLRCDANISICPEGSGTLGTKTELKNLNSFKSVKDSLESEFKRQVKILEEGGKVVQETRLWNEKLGATDSMRSKEEAHDYRYFPEPDLVPFEFDEDFISRVKQSIPELPLQKKQRFVSEYGLSDYDAGVLTSQKALADYYESSVKASKGKQGFESLAKSVSNWMTTELLGRLNRENISVERSPVGPENLFKLVLLMNKGAISGKIAKTVFDEMFNSGKGPSEIIDAKGLTQISDETMLSKIVDEVMEESSKAVEEYKAGKRQALGSLVGKVMKKTSGKANPQVVNKLLQEKLQ